MSTLADVAIVLDPRSEHMGDLKGAGRDVGPLHGKVIGLKTDEFWFAWDWVAEEWATALRAEGAECVIWRESMPEGVTTPLATAAFNEFLDSVDAVVTGLATCGSCTFVAVRAGMAALERGHPTVFVATEHFERLARVLAEEAGWSDIRMAILPYPLEGRPEAEIRQIAREHYPALLKSIGATL